MRTRFLLLLAWVGTLGSSVGSAPWLAAEDAPLFTGIRRLTNNHEMVVTFTGPTGSNYRVEGATNLPLWSAIATLPARNSTSLQYTDAAAPYLAARMYRALQLPGATNFTGDHLATTRGDVIFHPVGHASLVMSWDGKMIYNDPTNGAAPYQAFPRADLILISHDHGDHFESAAINAVSNATTVLVVSGYVYSNKLSAAQKAIAVMLTNGASTSLLGLTIEAVPAYNGNHPRGQGNGYVLTLGGRRVYLSGDTGNTAEMRSLTNIDVAFVCMNYPYTMIPSDATNAVRAFRPRVVYPYHYRDSNGAVTNAGYFKQLLGTDPGIEVRLRKWY